MSNGKHAMTHESWLWFAQLSLTQGYINITSSGNTCYQIKKYRKQKLLVMTLTRGGGIFCCKISDIHVPTGMNLISFAKFVLYNCINF